MTPRAPALGDRRGSKKLPGAPCNASMHTRLRVYDAYYVYVCVCVIYIYIYIYIYVCLSLSLSLYIYIYI